MASGLTTDVVGTLVAVTSNEYSFKDQRTGEDRAGTSHRAWLSVAFDVAPIEVTLPPQSDLPVKFSVYSEPVRLHMRLEQVARNKGSRAVIEHRLVAFEEVAAENLPARSSKAS